MLVLCFLWGACRRLWRWEAAWWDEAWRLANSVMCAGYICRVCCCCLKRWKHWWSPETPTVQSVINVEAFPLPKLNDEINPNLFLNTCLIFILLSRACQGIWWFETFNWTMVGSTSALLTRRLRICPPLPFWLWKVATSDCFNFLFDFIGYQDV